MNIKCHVILKYFPTNKKCTLVKRYTKAVYEQQWVLQGTIFST